MGITFTYLVYFLTYSLNPQNLKKPSTISSNPFNNLHSTRQSLSQNTVTKHLISKETSTVSINFDKLKNDAAQQRLDEDKFKMRKNTFAVMDESHESNEEMKLFEEEDESMNKEDEEIYGGLGLWLRGQIA